MLPGFENTFAFRHFMTLLAKRFAGSDASKRKQMQIESEIPPQDGSDLPLTQLDRLKYFGETFRNVHFYFFDRLVRVSDTKIIRLKIKCFFSHNSRQGGHSNYIPNIHIHLISGYVLIFRW